MISCIKHSRGYFNNIDKVRDFEVYNFSKSDVVYNIGKPQITLDDDKTWIYYSYIYKNPRMLKHQIKQETILIVYFDNSDNIKKYEFIDRNVENKLSNIKGSDKEEKTKLMKELFKDVLFTPVAN